MNEKSIPLQTSERGSVSRGPAGDTQLKVVDPGTIVERMNDTFEAIARRAFELFEQNGWIHGHDLENWTRAEAEFLHPVHLRLAETRDSLTVQAEVPGFEANELQVSLEPTRLTITGKKQSTQDEKDKQTIYKDQCRSEILRSITLPVEVDPNRATATLRNGMLELNLPKAAEARATQIQVKTATTGR